MSVATQGDEPVVEVDGAVVVELDPFSRHRAFARWVRTGKLRNTFQSFLDAWREPIDTKADKRMDLAAFGKPAHQFLKLPRPKRNDEFPEGYEDRLKQDLERQFILRNLARYVKTVNRDDPLEYERRKVGVTIDLAPRIILQDLHRTPEFTNPNSVQRVREESEWRHRMLEVMQWERYYCKEIKDDFAGPLWKHDPDTNPVTRPEDTSLSTSAGSAAGDRSD